VQAARHLQKHASNPSKCVRAFIDLSVISHFIIISQYHTARMITTKISEGWRASFSASSPCLPALKNGRDGHGRRCDRSRCRRPRGARSPFLSRVSSREPSPLGRPSSAPAPPALTPEPRASVNPPPNPALVPPSRPPSVLGGGEFVLEQRVEGVGERREVIEGGRESHTRPSSDNTHLVETPLVPSLIPPPSPGSSGPGLIRMATPTRIPATQHCTRHQHSTHRHHLGLFIAHASIYGNNHSDKTPSGGPV